MPAVRGRRRLIRIAALGGGSMLLASAAHLIGGGRLPSPAVLAVTTFLVGLTALTVTARRTRFWLFAVVLGVQQLLLHEVFVATSMTSPGCPPQLSGGHTATMSGCLADPHAAAGMAGSGVGMVLAHLAATLATAFLLARAEAWLWNLGERVVRVATATPTPRVQRARSAGPQPRPTVLTGCRRTAADPRGPPARSCSV